MARCSTRGVPTAGTPSRTADVIPAETSRSSRTWLRPSTPKLNVTSGREIVPVPATDSAGSRSEPMRKRDTWLMSQQRTTPADAVGDRNSR